MKKNEEQKKKASTRLGQWPFGGKAWVKEPDEMVQRLKRQTDRAETETDRTVTRVRSVEVIWGGRN